MNRIVNWVNSFDVSLFQFINHNLKCRFFDFTLSKITHLGGATITLSTLTGLLFISGQTLRTWTLQALLSLIISHIIVHIIKKIYRRERPYETLNSVHLGANPLKDYSFPSGHTTAIFSVTVAFALHSAMLAMILLPIAILVGFSRLYLGVHYPTDVIVGASIGILTATIIVFQFSF